MAQQTNQDIHDKYAGKIVFAEKKINFENIDNGILKDHFRLLNNIYGKAFLEMSLAEYYENYNWSYDYKDADLAYNFSTTVFIDEDMAIKLFDELAPGPFNNYTYLDIVLAPDNSDKYEYSLISSDWADQVSGLSEGDHIVRVEIRAESKDYPGLNKKPVALGEFTLHVERTKIDEFTRKFDITPPRPTIIDAEIEAEIIDASEFMFPGMVPISAVIIEPTGQWQYDRDMEGNILSRNFLAAVILKTIEGECFVKTARFFQDHKGNFQFDKVRMSEKVKSYYNYSIPCENVE
jgi:hypothetical protein